ncbi:MAG: hypothetical protein ACRENE_32235 [Polyangiaceae bacterium]
MAKIDRQKAREVASVLGLDETTVVALATMKEDDAAKALAKVDPPTRAKVLEMLRGLRA